MKTKLSIFLFLISLSHFAFGQPGDPCIYSDKRIEELNELIEKEPENYIYLWERARLRVNCPILLTDNDSIIEDVTFLINEKAVIPSSQDETLGWLFIQITPDFNNAELNTLTKQYRNTTIDIREFYFLRGDLYTSMSQYGKAIADYSYAKQIDTTGIYHLRADYAILNIYNYTNDFENALKYTNKIIEYYKREEAINDEWHEELGYKHYFCQEIKANIIKTDLLKSLNRTDELIAFYKTFVIDAFELYITITESDSKKSCLIGYLENGYASIEELIKIYKEIGNIDLETKHKKIRKELNEGDINWETVNKRISVEKLKSIVSKIK